MANQQSKPATFQFTHALPGTKLFDWGSSANWVNGVTPGSLAGTANVTIPASSAGTSYDNVASLTLASLTEQSGAPAVEIGSGDILTAGTLGALGVIRVDANAKLIETGGAGGGYITLNGANATAELNGTPSAAFTFVAGDPSSVYLRQVPLGASTRIQSRDLALATRSIWKSRAGRPRPPPVRSPPPTCPMAPMPRRVR